MRMLLTIYCLMLSCCFVMGQTNTNGIVFPDKDSTESGLDIADGKAFRQTEKSYKKLSDKIRVKNEQVLRSFKLSEDKLKNKISILDNNKAMELFDHANDRYDELSKKITSPVNKAISKTKEYLPRLDSMQTVMKFMELKHFDLSEEKLNQIKDLSGALNELQVKIQQANDIQDFVREREKQLKEALLNSGFGKELSNINKQVYYYQQQLAEYKAMLYDKQKMQEKIISSVSKLPAFQKFFRENSYLSQLFRLPGTGPMPVLPAGLQTRTFVQQDLVQRLSAPGSNPQQYVQQQLQSAQSQLDKLKDKLNELGGGGSSDMTMPDFKRNDQKSKNFFKRLEFGFDMQNQRKDFLLPAISDFALSAGYKIDDKKVVGLAASYKMGWGSGWNNVRFSSEGIGLRSYFDIKAKGSLWISGGWEYNYLQRFNNLSMIKNLDAWQRSGLIGLTKKYQVGKRKCKVQILWDFMSYNQIPASQPIKFRIGTQL